LGLITLGVAVGSFDMIFEKKRERNQVYSFTFSNRSVIKLAIAVKLTQLIVKPKKSKKMCI
jgi:hypothetical protein